MKQFYDAKVIKKREAGKFVRLKNVTLIEGGLSMGCGCAAGGDVLCRCIVSFGGFSLCYATFC